MMTCALNSLLTLYIESANVWLETPAPLAAGFAVFITLDPRLALNVAGVR